MNGKKARALRKFTRQKINEYLQDPEKYPELQANWGSALRILYKASKKAYNNIPKDRKRNG